MRSRPCPGLRIVGEYLVPVDFVLVARPGTKLEDVPLVAAHPVAYAQCQLWLDRDPARPRAPPGIEQRRQRDGAARRNERRGCRDRAAGDHSSTTSSSCSPTKIGDNPNAVTRFVLVSRTVAPPPPTGADKTALIAELPDDHPGALLEMLEQFATRGVNL